MNWLLELAIFIAAAVIGGELCKKIKISPLIGEIAAGLIFSGIYLSLSLPKEVFILTIFSELGVLFILFLIGMETDLKQMLKVSVPAFSVAVAGIVVPFLAGLALGKWYGWTMPVTLFAAATLVATSIAISAKSFLEMKFVKDRAAQIVVGAAVIDDILGLLVLTLVMTAVDPGGESIGDKLQKIGIFFFIVLPAVWILLPKGMQWVKQRFNAELEGVLCLAFLFFICYLSQWFGMAPIIGAFFLGVLYSIRRDHNLHQMVHPFYLLLAPLFFFGIGFHVELNSFVSGLGMALVFTLAAIVSKLVGGYLGAAAVRLPHRESVLIGVAMIPRGEVGLIIAGIGHSMKIVNDEIFAAAAVMCLLTTLIPPFFLPSLIRWVKKN